MIKGWRNDPRWVAHYAALDEARIQRAIERMKFESNMRVFDLQLESALRDVRRHPPNIGADADV